MVAHRRLRPAAGFLALLPFIGMWVGHTLEYLRVEGLTPAFSEVAFGSVHAYMLPLALVLAATAVFFAADLFRLWAGLGARLDEARARLGAVLSGRIVDPSAAPCAEADPSLTSRLLIAWPALAAVQTALYLIQENVEAVAARLPAPGLAPVTGAHALAPVVQASVALGLIAATEAVTWLLRRRACEVARVEAIVTILVRALRRGARQRVVVPRAVFPRPELRGAALFGRAPPASLAA